MTAKDIIGNYSVIGTNQDNSENTYKGTLNLSFDNYKRIEAKWLINNTQEQTGVGFFKNNILVIHFKYRGYQHKFFNGTVVYKFLNIDILEGFWSEDNGNPAYLGTENCFRVKDYIPD